ncbi:MAG: hypothetical protein MJZ75_03095 [Paludibacteraceae bacterium]|nr:hypothetical protein [Paludibacteraceae bacterium]
MKTEELDEFVELDELEEQQGQNAETQKEPDTVLGQSVVGPLLTIVERRKQLSQFDQSKTFNVPFARLDYLEAQLLPYHHLNEDEKEHLLRDYILNVDFNEYSFMRYILHMQPPQAEYQKTIKPNTPFRSLVRWFQDRKSKKVQIARNELLQRYLYLDPKDQLTVRLILLHSPILTDQEKGLKYCLEAWDGKEFDTIHDIWERECVFHNYSLWYLAGKLLIKHASTEFVKNEQHKLYGFDGKHIHSIYFHVALRLIKEDSFAIQKELLHIEDYYRLLYHTNQQISVSEWENDIYQVVADIYIHNSRCSNLPYYACGRALTSVRFNNSNYIPDYIYPEQIQIPVEERAAWNQATHRDRRLIELQTIRQMLLYGALGGVPVQSFVDYANQVDKTIVTLYGHEVQSCNGMFGWGDTETYEKFVLKNKDKRCPAAEELLSLCPQQYKHFFEERIIEHEQEIQRLTDIYPESLDNDDNDENSDGNEPDTYRNEPWVLIYDR